MAELRKVLFIAYHFPPCGGVSSVRSTEFARRLAEFGWLPVVLTVSEEAYEGFPIDRRRLADLSEDIPIHRVPGRCANSKFRLLYKFRLGRLVPACYCPDHEMYEARRMYAEAYRLIAVHKCEAIYSTSGPRSSHLVALLAKRKAGLPWVADFRDPWDDSNDLPYASRLHRGLSHWLERLVAKRADVLVANTPGSAALMERKLGSGIRHKLHTIPNGYSEMEFTREVTAPENALVTFVSVGSIYGRYFGPDSASGSDATFPLSYFRSIASAMAASPSLRSSVRFKFVGDFDPENRRVLDDLDISDVVNLVGVVSKQEAIDHMKRATVNVLLPGNDCPPYIVAARTYEMLRAGRTMLALTPGGDMADLLRKAGGAIIVDPNDEDAIAEGIYRVVDGVENGDLPVPDENVVRQYERGALTCELAGLLDSITASPRDAMTAGTGR